MKKLFSLTFLLLLGATSIFAQGMPKEKQRASPHDTVTAPGIKVTYGRPYKKGRDVFGGLVEYGKVWRTGADEATEITLERGGVLAGRQISAGTYTLFTIPGKNEWTVIINKELHQWGAFKYDESKDLFRVQVPAIQNLKSVEQFTITPSENGLTIEWDKTKVVIPLRS